MSGGELVPYQNGWVEVVGPASELAERVYRTEFVPEALRSRPEAVLAAILTGHEVGIGPMQALAKINVIKGKPTMSAELMRALVQRAGHDIWTEEYGSTRVVLCGKRAGREHVTKVTWTLDDAKRAGLAGRDNWRAYPRSMLLARATSELCRLMFADVLGGISYSAEELEDGGGEPAAAAPAAEPEAPKTHTRKARAKAPAVEAVPAPPPEPAEETNPTPASPPLPGEAGYDTPEALVARAQAVATKARRANIDRGQAVEKATHGRTRSAKALTDAEAADALHAIGEEAARAASMTQLRAAARARNPEEVQSIHAWMEEIGIGAATKLDQMEPEELATIESEFRRRGWLPDQ
jgi:hypothetical protein